MKNHVAGWEPNQTSQVARVRSLPRWFGDEPPAVLVEALRMVLAITLTREQVARVGGLSVESSMSLWPSSLYRIVASTALSSTAIWRRCARTVEAELRVEYGYALEADYASVLDFCQHREWKTWEEVASLLWGMVTQNSPLLYASSPLLEEVKLLALHRFPTPQRDSVMTPIETEHPTSSDARTGVVALVPSGSGR